MDLPVELRGAIDSELAGRPPKELVKLVEELSSRYRTDLQAAAHERLVKSADDAAAYAAFRLPATYGAVYGALCQIKAQLPEFHPSSLLDVGAGPGTVMWAAHHRDLWQGSLEKVTLLEREPAMISLGKRLAAWSSLVSIQEAEWMAVDLTEDWETSSHDLVAAAYVLGELPAGARRLFIQRLWEKTAGALVIIEPGTPAGFVRIQKARQMLLAVGGRIVAPCPHSGACPMDAGDWCHFSQRIPRSRLHRQVKAGELGYEDEKFAFVAFSRQPGETVQGRVVRHPQIRKGHVRLKVCTSSGLTDWVVSRKEKDVYRQARNLKWGSPVNWS
ncbi:MAG: rRNA methyltransferase [Firmicutes bacterium]|nr:rRNA methyltransferase [Bacillota bacterium]